MSYIATDSTITVYHDGRPYTLTRATANDAQWDSVLGHLHANNIEAAARAIDVSTAVTDHFDGEIQIRHGQVYYRDRAVDTYAARRAVEFMRSGLPYKPLLQFIERLEKNPSYRAVQDLYKFLEHAQLPLTEDGCFLAYKKVRRDDNGRLVDIYSQSMDNSVGARVEMPRNQVDEDPDNTCSHGLHVCAYDYLQHFGSGPADTAVTVKIDPADVVAIPADYDNTKMRVCAYEVIEELGGLPDDVLRGVGVHITDPSDDDWLEWSGTRHDGPSDLTSDTEVEIRLRSGLTNRGEVIDFIWEHRNAEYDIVAYRVIDDEFEDDDVKIENIRNDETGAGWVAWDGSDGDGPPELEGDGNIEVRLRNGTITNGEVGDFRWTHSSSAFAAYDIVAYRPID